MSSQMQAERRRAVKHVGAYFALVAVLTLPFWIADAIADEELLPGVPIAGLAVLVPTLSACLIVWLSSGRKDVRALLSSVCRRGQNMLPVASFAIALPIGVAALSWSQAETLAWPGLKTLAVLAPLLLVAAIAEEIGWSAYATTRLTPALSPLGAGLLVGAVWAVWHFPAFLDLGRSTEWVAWWTIWTVAQRLVMVRLYLAGGAWIWGPVLFHAASNAAWQAAPDAFDPKIQGIAMLLAAAAVSLAPAVRSKRN